MPTYTLIRRGLLAFPICPGRSLSLFSPSPHIRVELPPRANVRHWPSIDGRKVALRIRKGQLPLVASLSFHVDLINRDLRIYVCTGYR